MKALSIVNIILCLILVVAACFLVLKTEEAVAKIDKFAAAQEDRIRELSDEISRAWTRIGQVEATSARLAQRMETLSSKNSATANLESEVRKVMGEQRRERMGDFQRQADRWQGVQLKPKQRELATKMMQEGAKDLMDLHAKVQAGEVTREEAGRMIRERWQTDIAKFQEAVEKADDEKAEDEKDEDEKPAGE